MHANRLPFAVDVYEEPASILLPTDTHVTAPAEVARLGRQNAAVLARLQQGPATRAELQALAPNVTARISDLRSAGYRIPKPAEDVASGLTVYRLASPEWTIQDEINWKREGR